MSDADLLDDLIARLFMLREEMGSNAYREACLKAAVAVARVALLEAEGRAPRKPKPASEVVVRFPFGRRRHPEGEQK